MAQLERKTEKNKPESRADFKPLVISAGGLMSKETKKVFESWTELDKYEIARLYQAIGISLLLARTRKMTTCLLLNDNTAE